MAPGRVVVDGVDGPELGNGTLDEGSDRLLPADIAVQADGAAPAASTSSAADEGALGRDVADDDCRPRRPGAARWPARCPMHPR